jgi:tetratricopeptide (TPR) repeat protein
MPVEERRDDRGVVAVHEEVDVEAEGPEGVTGGRGLDHVADAPARLDEAARPPGPVRSGGRGLRRGLDAQALLLGRRGYRAGAAPKDGVVRRPGRAPSRAYHRDREVFAIDPIAAGTRWGTLEFEREIGRGAFGTVWLAHDATIGRPVAVKVVLPASGTPARERERALAEARLVGRLNHANVVTLHHVHSLPEGGWMLEMEHVPGGSLEDRLAEKRPLSFDEAVRVGRSLVAGLAAAHEDGVVHGDVKPANVLLGPHGAVKVADFGLGRLLAEERMRRSSEGLIVGTPYYMAPEVVMGERPTPASDVWSAAVVVHELLARQLPFPSSDLHALFNAIQNAEPRPLPQSVPEGLRSLLRACLAKRAADRPGSCAAVLDLFDRAVVSESPSVSRPTRASATRAALVGRERETQAFEAALERSSKGEQALLVVTGPRGIGRSAFLREAAAVARRRGFVCVEASPGVEGLLVPLARAVRSASGDASAAPAGQESFGLLAHRLEALASAHPVAVLVDDLQEADESDARAFARLARHLSDARALFVGAVRTAEGKAAAVLEALDDASPLVLEPLSTEALHAVIEANVGVPVEAAVADHLLRTADGNPLFAVDLVRHLRESGAMVVEGGRARLGSSWESSPLPRRLRDLATRRLDRVSEGNRALLDAAAVDGVAFDGAAVADAVGRPLLAVLRGLQTLYREGGVVEPRARGWRFSNALFRDVVYEGVAPELRSALHRRLAEHFELRGALDERERIGVHWERAGDPLRARPHLLAAARAASARQEFRRTIDLHARAGVTPGTAAETLSSGVVEPEDLLVLAAAFNNTSRGQDAERLDEVVLAHAVETRDELLRLVVGVNRSQRRHYRTGLTAEEEADVRRAAETLPPCTTLARAQYLLAIRAKLRGDLGQAEAWLGRAQETFRRIGATEGQDSVLDQMASVALRRGKAEEAERLYLEAADVAERAGRPLSVATSHVNRAIVAIERGEFEGIEPALLRAIRRLSLHGEAGLAGHATVSLATLRYATGDLEGALRAVEEAVATAEETRYAPALVGAHLERGHLLSVAGRVAEAEADLATARDQAKARGDVGGVALAWAVETQRRCFAGDVDGAAESAASAARTASGVEDLRLRAQVAVWLAEATLYGLAPLALPTPEDVLRPGEAQGRTDASLAERAIRAARALAEDGAARTLAEGAEALRSPALGERRAALATAGGLFAALARRRAGDLAGAATEAQAALASARALGHRGLVDAATRLGSEAVPAA